MQRRDFIAALSALAALTEGADTGQAPEVPSYFADVPPGATLWGLAVFLTDEPIELTVESGRNVQHLRGRFDGERLRELTLRNDSRSPQRLVIRARALAGDRELPYSVVRYISEHQVYVAFGRRGVPERSADRHGAYPFEAVLMGFMVFERTG